MLSAQVETSTPRTFLMLQVDHDFLRRAPGHLFHYEHVEFDSRTATGSLPLLADASLNNAISFL
jgi:hypothetical protein